jgi:hypothetical protein
MAGNLVLRAMLIEPDIKAGDLAGAVYSYDDFGKYGSTTIPTAASDPDLRQLLKAGQARAIARYLRPSRHAGSVLKVKYV